MKNYLKHFMIITLFLMLCGIMVINTKAANSLASETMRVDGTKNFLALRSEPKSKDENIIGKLYNGDLVEVLSDGCGKHGTFSYVSSNAGRGYVKSKYLYPKEVRKRVDGTRHFLALRSEPKSKDENIIGKLYNCDYVQVLSTGCGKHGTFSYVSSNLGKGYVKSKYLYSGEEQRRVDGVTNYLALREKAKTDEKYIIGKLYNGDIVRLLSTGHGKNKDYSFISCSVGVGYVKSEYLSMNLSPKAY